MGDSVLMVDAAALPGTPDLFSLTPLENEQSISFASLRRDLLFCSQAMDLLACQQDRGFRNVEKLAVETALGGMQQYASLVELLRSRQDIFCEQGRLHQILHGIDWGCVLQADNVIQAAYFRKAIELLLAEGYISDDDMRFILMHWSQGHTVRKPLFRSFAEGLAERPFMQ